jgi:hypothetical protein
MGEERNTYRILVEKLEGKRPPGKLRCREEGNIKMDLQNNSVGWYGLYSCAS